MQIYDDISGPPPTPEQQARIKAWFDELVASGRIEALTVRISSGTVTFIQAGGTRNEAIGD